MQQENYKQCKSKQQVKTEKLGAKKQSVLHEEMKSNSARVWLAGDVEFLEEGAKDYKRVLKAHIMRVGSSSSLFKVQTAKGCKNKGN